MENTSSASSVPDPHSANPPAPPRGGAFAVPNQNGDKVSTSAELLREAQQALNDARAEPEGNDRRRSHAHHAATQSSDVIMRPESTPNEREQAKACLDQAVALQEAFFPRQRLGSLIQQKIENRTQTRGLSAPAPG